MTFQPKRESDCCGSCARCVWNGVVAMLRKNIRDGVSRVDCSRRMSAFNVAHLFTSLPGEAKRSYARIEFFAQTAHVGTPKTAPNREVEAAAAPTANVRPTPETAIDR